LFKGYGAKVGLGNMRVKAENRMVTYQLYIRLMKHIIGHMTLWLVELTYDHTYVLSVKLKGNFV
jgi:hypothetical protein